METEKDLNLRIINITVQIQEFYPELYRDLNEMFATLPISETPVINSTTLRKWLDSLKILVKRSLKKKFLIINKTNKRYQLKSPFDVYGIQIEIIGPDNVSIRKISVSEDALEMDSFYLIENDSAISIFNLDIFICTALL